MITAQELRIGNWVKDRGGKYIRIDFFEHLQKGYSCKFGMSNVIEGWGEVHPLTEYTEYAEPIPLTPEILIKAGFKLDPQRISIYLKERVKLWLGNNGAIAYLKNEDTDESYFIPNDPKYLHQLQNLYLALTGQELEVKF